ncbi:STAS domain-containing protein [Streptomyces poonensis]|uniref:STAS domain-containing protein n=1 Tax=Streptomyces poonensis TaxID=68255 RepID=A0A918UW32_9ACTN|nr:STAS domain-containing protein [Streptomyces poonensis]GGZ38125.1 hypothetical protein GCM10010365_68650 [Streptomyces poonensis]GLJ91075.1 hypothetical protein GCM10017589_36810 [Streptomyces poonensis]
MGPDGHAMGPDAGGRLVIRQVPAGRAAVLICLSGELDLDTTTLLREAIVQVALRPDDHRRLLLDLSALAYCDNAGLFALLGMCQALDAVGITVSITATGSVARVAITHPGRAAAPAAAAGNRSGTVMRERAVRRPGVQRGGQSAAGSDAAQVLAGGALGQPGQRPEDRVGVSVDAATVVVWRWTTRSTGRGRSRAAWRRPPGPARRTCSSKTGGDGGGRARPYPPASQRASGPGVLA